ncbi:hypothetical protein AGMMS50293_21850 [Spirochaetia bacterium]|nr:hypothetical protein AGMMS50293_21850 [Spirochaetia bacterium]
MSPEIAPPRDTVYVSHFAAWAPGVETPAEWKEWAEGKRKITISGESPSLNFTDWFGLGPREVMMFKRRLSQISKMVIQVIHDIMPFGENVKMTFVSFRGEITQQFKINKMLVEEGDIRPAAFSQSVFNTPPALASIAFNLRAGYSALYPSRFDSGFMAAAAPLLSGAVAASAAGETVLVYADELCPPEYPRPNRSSFPLEPSSPSEPSFPLEPLAFAVLLSAKPPEAGISPVRPVSLGRNIPASPEDFLKYLYSGVNP